MTFRTPDAALRMARGIRERCESVQAVDPVLQEGSRFARECSKCETRPYHLRFTIDGVPYALCKRCGRDRPREDVYILRTPTSGGAPPEAGVSDLADLDNLIGRARVHDPNRFAAYGAYILLDRSLPDIVRFCDRQGWGPGTGGGFTPWRMKHAVAKGRAALAWELHRVDLLEGDVTRWTEARILGPRG